MAYYPLEAAAELGWSAHFRYTLGISLTGFP